MGFIETWTSWQPFAEPSFNDSPWIFSTGIFIQSGIGKIFGLFWLGAVLGFFATAIGLVAKTSWWPAIAVVASILSLLAVVPWWQTFTPGIKSKVSAVVVDIILLIALVDPWKDQIVTRLNSG